MGGSGVGLAEFFHEIGEGNAAFVGHGIVNRGAHAADGAMALDTAQAVFQGLGDEFLFQFFRGQAEGHVHEGPAVLVGVAAIESAAVIDGIVDERRLFRIALRHSREAALALDPGRNLAHHVDAEGRRGIVQGILVVEGFIAQHGGQGFRALFQHGLPGNHQCHARRAQVLLDTGVNEAEPGEIQRPGKHIRGHIRDEGHTAGFRDVVVLSAVDGVVIADMQIGCVVAELDLLLGRDMAEVRFLAGSGHMAHAQNLGFLVGLAGKAAGKHIVADFAIGGEIQRNHVKLHAGAALDEQYLIIIAQSHELLDIGFGLIVYSIVGLGPMADLGDGHAGVLEIQEFGLGFLEYL